MKIEFKTEKVLIHKDGSKDILLDIRPEYQIFVGYLLEGLDGYCYHTIVDSPVEVEGKIKNAVKLNKKLMKVTVTSDFYSEIVNFLNDIQGYII